MPETWSCASSPDPEMDQKISKISVYIIYLEFQMPLSSKFTKFYIILA